MEIIDATQFTAERAWGNQALMTMGDYRARLHWTDEPYRWHQNSGEELFVVLDGIVDMHYATGEQGVPEVVELRPGQIALVQAGDRHVAHPRGVARILVLERHGSD
jgi:mannose-6-phosphate isomerase-like protein (cupin superfamily)